MAPFVAFVAGGLRVGTKGGLIAGRTYRRKSARPTRPGATNSRRARGQGSSSGAISPSISALTSSSSSSSSSRKASSAASSSSTSISSTTGSTAFSSVASTSSSETSSTPAGATASSSGSSSLALGRSARATTPWKIVPHFGQMIGSLFRSKNFAPQFWHWRFAPSSGFATAYYSLLDGGVRRLRLVGVAACVNVFDGVGSTARG